MDWALSRYHQLFGHPILPISISLKHGDSTTLGTPTGTWDWGRQRMLRVWKAEVRLSFRKFRYRTWLMSVSQLQISRTIKAKSPQVSAYKTSVVLEVCV